MDATVTQASSRKANKIIDGIVSMSVVDTTVRTDGQREERYKNMQTSGL